MVERSAARGPQDVTGSAGPPLTPGAVALTPRGRGRRDAQLRWAFVLSESPTGFGGFGISKRKRITR